MLFWVGIPGDHYWHVNFSKLFYHPSFSSSTPNPPPPTPHIQCKSSGYGDVRRNTAVTHQTVTVLIHIKSSVCVCVCVCVCVHLVHDWVKPYAKFEALGFYQPVNTVRSDVCNCGTAIVRNQSMMSATCLLCEAFSDINVLSKCLIRAKEAGQFVRVLENSINIEGWTHDHMKDGWNHDKVFLQP